MHWHLKTSVSMLFAKVWALVYVNNVYILGIALISLNNLYECELTSNVHLFAEVRY